MSQPECFGRYEVKKVLGRGAMGVVYLAEDPVIGREVAIKVIQAHAGLDGQELDQLQARFEREFKSAGTLSHPSIVTIHDVGQEDDCSFIAMEFVRGEGLDEILASNRILSFKEIADLTLQVCDGLDYAHERGVIHRDIKPANIIITRQGRPKITDFGIAKVTTTTLTRTGTVIGTPSYMSPEQVTGHPVTGASDQFSVAVMTYQLLTGERPFSGDSPTTIMYKIVHEDPVRPKILNARLPQELDIALMRALDKDPAQRYPVCSAFAEAVRDALGAAPADATVALTDSNAATVIASASELPVSDPSAARRYPPLPATAASSGSQSGTASHATRGRVPLFAGLAAVAVVVCALGIWAILGRDGGAETEQPEDPARTSAVAPVGGGGREGVQQPSEDSGDRPSEDNPLDRGTAEGGDEDPGEREDPATPVPETYTITSDPVGAQVFVDGVEQEGTTPVEIQISPGRRYEVRVQMAGYEPAGWAFTDDMLSDAHRQSRELLFSLEADIPPGTLVLDNAPYPVQIAAQRLDDTGDPTGRPQTFEAAQNHEIELASGSWQVEMSAPSVYFHRVDRVAVEAEGRHPIVVPRAVNVRVMAYPANCQVSIDGNFHDSTPFGVALVIGDHEFHFDWSAVGEGEKTVTHTIGREGQEIIEQSGRR
jgi:serine/threonine protein kinase